MKSPIVLAFSCALGIGGCYSYSTISESERGEILSAQSEDIRIRLDDNSEVTLKPYHYIEVTEPSDFVYGVGQRWGKASKSGAVFKGKSSYISIDSTYHTTGPLWDLHREIEYYNITAQDSSTLRFAKENFFLVSKDQGSGFWCAGRMSLEGRSEWFAGRIPSERIVQIEERKLSYVETGIWAAVFAAGVSLFIVGVSSSFSLGSGW